MQFSKFILLVMTLYMRETESHKWREKESFETLEALSDWCQATYYLISGNNS